MTRSELRDIVKECLIEILSDGIGPMNESRPAVKQQKQAVPARRSPLDERASISRRPTVPTFAVNTITNDPVMQGIFADTVGTLQRQNENGHNAPGQSSTPWLAGAPPADNAARVMSENNPDQLFEGSDRWADLAFMQKSG